MWLAVFAHTHRISLWGANRDAQQTILRTNTTASHALRNDTASNVSEMWQYPVGFWQWTWTVQEVEKHQPQQIWTLGFHPCTHTQAGGGKEGGNKDSQPQPRRARAQSKTRNKAKPTSSDAIEPGQQREGTNTLLGGGERGPGGWEGAQKRGRKRDGPSYTPVSRAAPEEGEGEARTDEDITWPHGYFSLVGTSPKAWRYKGYFAIWLTNVSVLDLECPPRHSELSCARSADGFRMLAASLSNHGHHFPPRRNVETVQPIVERPWTHSMWKVMGRFDDVAINALRFQNLGKHPGRFLIYNS